MKLWGLLMRMCGGLSAVFIAAITMLVGYDVIARNIGLGSLPWVLEISEYMLPALICASAPWLMFRGAHIRLDLMKSLIGWRLGSYLDRLCAIAATVSAGLFTWYAFLLLQSSHRTGSIVIKALIFPEWWIYLPVPIGFGLLTLECARQIFMRPQTQADLVS